MMYGLKSFQLVLVAAALVSENQGTFLCNYGGVTLQESKKAQVGNNGSILKIENVLPPNFGQTQFCVATTRDPQSFLFVTAKTSKTTEGKNAGALYVSLFAEGGAQQGHMDVFSSAGATQDYIQLCPALNTASNKDTQRHQIVFSGSPTLAYTAEVAYTKQSISLGQKKNLTVASSSHSIFFSFEAPEDITSAQLEITAISDSSVSAYLTVSHTCNKVLGHKIGSLGIGTSSLRLSFSKKGRIILSHASSPKLKGGETWYIGIALKNASGSVHLGTSKNVTLSLKKGFNYDYTKPMCFLVFASLFGGIFIAVWALYCFREPLLLVKGDNQFSESVLSVKKSFRSMLRSCCVGTDEVDELSPLLPRNSRDNSLLSVIEVMQAMWTVLRHHWLGHGPKTFSHTTCIVGFVLLVGAFQFVYENWRAMVDTGDRDKCYYNDFCYWVSGTDIPFNLMISNLVYMIHGIILAWSVWVMEAELWAWSKRLAEANRFKVQEVPHDHEEIPKHLLKCQNIAAHMSWMTIPKLEPSSTEASVIYANAHKGRVNYSIGYAFAWALVFEGFFSLLYHFCPSRMTFQFDTAFMFVIAGLIVLSLFNGFSVKAYCEEKIATPVEAGNFFLFVIVPLYIFNYLGSLYALTNYNLNQVVKVLFIVCLCIWYVLVFLWAGGKLFYRITSCGDLSSCKERTKVVFFVITIAVTCVLLPILMEKDLPDLFLFSCIAASLISIIGKVVTMLCQSNQSTWTFESFIFRVFQGLYVFMTLAMMGVAVWVFNSLATTDKTLSPEESRDLNRECCLLGFFGYHDLWHILSSFALLMGAYLVMYVSE